MPDVTRLIEKARHSPFNRRLLSWGLGYVIPFNKPHHFSIESISDDRIRVLLPFRKRNLNHIGGLHACALATLAEFTSGLLLIAKLGMKSYRLILQRLEVDYLYQGKVSAVADFELTDEWIEEHVKKVLVNADRATVKCTVPIYDVKGNQLAACVVIWQIKAWKNVKTARAT